MPRAVWLLGLVLVTGCHGPSVVVSRPPARPSGRPAARELSTVQPNRIEPTLGNLPVLDAKTADAGVLFAANRASFRGLNEIECLALAARQSPMANLLERENEKPSIGIVQHKTEIVNLSKDEFVRELRSLAAADLRHRDAAEAIDRYFQLADAEGRTELLSSGLKSFDELRALAPRLRAAGLPTPDDDELTRQRSKLLGDIEAAEAGIQLLNVDLQTRLGLSVTGSERLWPNGSFEIAVAPIDVDAAVARALATRADLQLLRALYHGANTETLPIVSEHLKSVTALVGASMPPGIRYLVAHQNQKLMDRWTAATRSEVDVRREQVFELVAGREAMAAAEVRTAALQRASAARRIALAKGRAESWKEKVEKATREEKQFDRLSMELEWYRARAEVVQEAMAWHRWNAKFLAAQGTLLESIENGK